MSIHKTIILLDAENICKKELIECVHWDLKQSNIEIIEKRAYGDKRNYEGRKALNVLQEKGYKWIHTPHLIKGKKNTADSYIIADAVESAYNNPDIDIITIVSNDSDYIGCLHAIHNTNKQIYCYGLQNLPLRAQKTYDKFIDLNKTLKIKQTNKILNTLTTKQGTNLITTNQLKNELNNLTDIKFTTNEIKNLVLNLPKAELLEKPPNTIRYGTH